MRYIELIGNEFNGLSEEIKKNKYRVVQPRLYSNGDISLYEECIGKGMNWVSTSCKYRLLKKWKKGTKKTIKIFNTFWAVQKNQCQYCDHFVLDSQYGTGEGYCKKIIAMMQAAGDSKEKNKLYSKKIKNKSSLCIF